MLDKQIQLTSLVEKDFKRIKELFIDKLNGMIADSDHKKIVDIRIEKKSYMKTYEIQYEYIDFSIKSIIKSKRTIENLLSSSFFKLFRDYIIDNFKTTQIDKEYLEEHWNELVEYINETYKEVNQELEHIVGKIYENNELVNYNNVLAEYENYKYVRTDEYKSMNKSIFQNIQIIHPLKSDLTDGKFPTIMNLIKNLTMGRQKQIDMLLDYLSVLFSEKRIGNVNRPTLIIYGTGGSGKSTFINLLRHIHNDLNVSSQFEQSDSYTDYRKSLVVFCEEFNKESFKMEKAMVNEIKLLSGASEAEANKKYGTKDNIKLQSWFILVSNENKILNIDESCDDNYKNRYLILNVKKSLFGTCDINFNTNIKKEIGAFQRFLLERFESRIIKMRLEAEQKNKFYRFGFPILGKNDNEDLKEYLSNNKSFSEKQLEEFCMICFNNSDETKSNVNSLLSFFDSKINLSFSQKKNINSKFSDDTNESKTNIKNLNTKNRIEIKLFCELFNIYYNLESNKRSTLSQKAITEILKKINRVQIDGPSHNIFYVTKNELFSEEEMMDQF